MVIEHATLNHFNSKKVLNKSRTSMKITYRRPKIKYCLSMWQLMMTCLPQIMTWVPKRFKWCSTNQITKFAIPMTRSSDSSEQKSNNLIWKNNIWYQLGYKLFLKHVKKAQTALKMTKRKMRQDEDQNTIRISSAKLKLGLKGKIRSIDLTLTILID